MLFRSTVINGGNGAINALNLRGLGAVRTLTLLNGQRTVGSINTGVVDVSELPQQLINRVDVVTGGASAAWGSDAVAGVANYVLDKKFTGMKGLIQGGTSGKGDNGTQKFGAALGHSFGEDDKGHVLFSAEYYRNEGMRRNQRDIGTKGFTHVGANASCVNTTTDPTACSPGGTLNPWTIAPDVRLLAASDGGKITASNIAGFPYLNYVFNPNGSLRPFVNGTAVGTVGQQIGGDGYRIPDKTHTNDPMRNVNVFGRVDYDVAPDVNVYLQGT